MAREVRVGSLRGEGGTELRSGAMISMFRFVQCGPCGSEKWKENLVSLISMAFALT